MEALHQGIISVSSLKQLFTYNLCIPNPKPLNDIQSPDSFLFLRDAKARLFYAFKMIVLTTRVI